MPRTPIFAHWLCTLALTTAVVYLCGVRLSTAQTAGTPTADAKSPSNPLPTIRLRAGSTTPFKDSEGNAWLPDVASKEGGFEGGELADRPDDMAIKNTKEQGLYRCEHWGMDSFSYKLPNGKYIVNLHFAETYDGISGPGSRVFSFTVQGKEFNDFDVWQKAGGPQRAYIEKVPVDITNGKLKITFTSSVDNPEINGIEIIPADKAVKTDTPSVPEKPMSSNLNSPRPAANAATDFTPPPGMPPVADFPKNYKGTPFIDSKYKDGAQKIPGTLICAYYDRGGEGVAYHDTDANNKGSGELNPLDGKYLNEFRADEGVDTSYTKNFADFWEGETIQPPKDMLYVGWTDPGEWINYTVDVAQDGEYTVDILYTSNKGGALSLDVNGKPLEKPITIATTNDPKDTTAWRQWHHWNINKNAATVKLSQGRNLLTVHIVENGNMNLGTLEFKPLNK